MDYLVIAKKKLGTIAGKNLSSLDGEKREISEKRETTFQDPYFKGYWETYVPKNMWPQWKHNQGGKG